MFRVLDAKWEERGTGSNLSTLSGTKADSLKYASDFYGKNQSFQSSLAGQLQEVGLGYSLGDSECHVYHIQELLEVSMILSKSQNHRYILLCHSSRNN